MAVEFANKHLDTGASLEDMFARSEQQRGGFYLSVRKLAAARFEIGFGYVAGGLAGDGGTWTVTYGADDAIEQIEPGELLTF